MTYGPGSACVRCSRTGTTREPVLRGFSVTPSSRATVDQVRFRQPPTSAGPSSRFYLPASARRAA